MDKPDMASSLDEPDVVEFNEETTGTGLTEEEVQEKVEEAIAAAVSDAMAEGDIPWLEGAQKKQAKLAYPDYNPVDVLLTKLERWLIVQPEWAVILAAPRKTRRQAINLISKRLLTIPNRYSNFGG